MLITEITEFERRRDELLPPRHFIRRLLKAIGLWLALAVVGLPIGMADYSPVLDIHLPPFAISSRQA
jgi:hypothetical protein